MTRRLLLVIAFLVTDLISLAAPASAAGSVGISAWNCGKAAVTASDSAETFAAECKTEVANSTFALTAGGVTRRRATAVGKPASWPAVAGAFSVKIDNPFGLASAVFCQRDDAAAEAIAVANDQIAGDMGQSASLKCLWYLFTADTPPTAQPTATPTKSAPAPTKAPTKAPEIKPTATPRQAPPTATPRQTIAAPAPTATPRVVSTPAESTPEPTATPANVPTEPAVIYPPAMYRSNPQRTGVEVGPGPEGDPLLLWRYPIANRPVSSPILSGDTIYIGGDNGLFAIDARTGTLRWLFATEQTVESTPAVVDGLVYFGGKDGILYCLDAQSGTERWRMKTGGMIISSPLVDNGRVYIVSYDGGLYAADAQSGEEQWVFQIEGTEYVSSPAMADGVVVVGSGDIDGGFLYGVEADTGVGLWQHQVAGAIGSTPAIDGGVVYFGSDDGFAYALNLDSIKREWKEGTGKLIRSSAGVFDGTIYFGNRSGNLYAYDQVSGETRWEFDSGDWIDSSPSFADGKIYVGTKKRKLLVINPADGTSIWEYQIGSSITTSPVVEDSVVYVAARDGFLYAIGGTVSSAAAADAAVNAARPADVPLEVVVDGERYLFDRMIQLDPAELSLTSQVGKMSFYTRDGENEFGAIYANHPAHDEETETDDTDLARYLPQFAGVEGAVCASSAPRSAAIISDGQSSFAFAGMEPDLTVDALTEVASSPELGSVYSNTSSPPFLELYVVDNDVLQRYVLLDGDGLSENLQGMVPFGGQVYAFADDITEETTIDDLRQIGCSGPFPVYANAKDDSAPYAQIVVGVANQLLQFDEVDRKEPLNGRTPGVSAGIADEPLDDSANRWQPVA